MDKFVGVMAAHYSYSVKVMVQVRDKRLQPYGVILVSTYDFDSYDVGSCPAGAARIKGNFYPML